MRRLLLLSVFVAFIQPAITLGNPTKIQGLAELSTQEAQHWVDSVMNSLTLREKIAQLFMVAAYSNRDQEHIDEIAKLVKDERIGGLCFFQGGPVRQVNLTNYYQGLAKVPLLISMDAEWGLGMRLDSTISYPRQMMLGAMDDNRLIYHMGADIARQLKRIGVHINFAPVVDINNNPQNPVINTRAFGEDREAVTLKGLAYMLGLQDNGILASAKHFPGYGDTDTDSHYDLPLLNHSRERIDSLELYPFRKLIQSGVASVMVGHMEIPALESKSKLASSLSTNVVTNMLTHDLQYNGLIITDAVNMKGVSDYYKPVDLNYLALQAGNDIVLFPSEVKESISKIEKEVKRGRFPIEEIERRCRKVIEAKYRVGLDRFRPIETANLVEKLNQTSSELIIRQIAEQAITVTNNRNDIIPLKGIDTLSIAYIEVGPDRGKSFAEQMELYAPFTTISVDPNISEDGLRDIYFSLSPYNLVIIGYHTISSSPQRDFGVTPQMAQFIADVSKKKRTLLGIFGSPYALGKLVEPDETNSIFVTYDNSSITQSVAAQLIFGGLSVGGRLPVTASPCFAYGDGMDAGKQIRLKYSIPEELSLKARYFSKIDSIALDAIAREAAPGMQILVAQRGTVVYNKTFGHHTYNDLDLPVTNQSVYDIASVTKIASTLPMVMDLYSKGKLDISDTLGKYLSLPDTSHYSSLLISDMLLHQAGLVAWIPFYQRTLSSLWPKQAVVESKFSESYPYQLSRNRFVSRQSFPSRKYYRNHYSYDFPHEVGRNLYAAESMPDSIYSWIFRAPVAPRGNYRYSDLGIMLMFRVAGNIIGGSQEEYLFNTFFKKLGMHNTLYNPLAKLSVERIVPTENDVVFRKQLVWGHVHDPGAAMLGGVAGHAGLFSTANDLAKLMQMYLSKGNYGGETFLPSSTIDLFTTCLNCQNGVRRGLGFDKPEPDPLKSTHVSTKATSLSFGHTGFTGAMAWVDPAYDLVYIFLSNRVFPEAENSRLMNMDVRTKIQDIIYDAVNDELF